jgi:hypothetical protein
MLRTTLALGWIQDSVVVPSGEVHEVRAQSAVDLDGAVLLDRGRGIRPRSVALSRDRRSVTWAAAGSRRSARLR